jgi:hypothetical protein
LLEQSPVAIQREVLKVIGIRVVGLKERGGGEDLAARLKDSVHLRNSKPWLLQVLEDSFTVHRSYRGVRKW